MSDPHANQMDYYVNWPGKTKAEVDLIYSQLPEDDWPEHKRPVARQQFDDDLIPDATSDHSVSEIWSEMNEVIDGIDVLDAYERWILPHKPMRRPPAPGKREVMIRCPLPDHADHNPSATLNREQGVWNCHACSIGGDKFDLAAIHFGFDRSEIRGPGFADLKREMAADLGWMEAGRDPKGNPRLVKAMPGAENETLKALETAPPPPEIDPEPEESISIDWRSILPVNTPMREGMDQLSRTDIPDEFAFWGLMQMMALAGGKQILTPGVPPIYPSLYVLLIGTTSMGKSRCCSMIERLLREALPFEKGELRPQGVLVPGTPGSGEGIYTAMAPTVDEFDDDGKPQKAQGVKAFWHIAEFAEFSKRKGRSGDTSAEILMSMYDCPPMIQLQLRKGSDELVDPFACVISTVQPAVVNEYIQRNDVQSGLINRWIPVMGTPKRPQISDPYIPDMSAFIDGIGACQGWAHHATRQIVMTSEAKARWEQFYFNDLHPLLSNDEDALASIWGRLFLHFRKIMAVLCLNERRTEVDLELLERTLSLWPYMRQCHRRLIGRIERTPKETNNGDIISVLASVEGRRLKKSALKRQLRSMLLDDFNASIRALIEADQVYIVRDDRTGGRPAEWVVLAEGVEVPRD